MGSVFWTPSTTTSSMHLYQVLFLVATTHGLRLWISNSPSLEPPIRRITTSSKDSQVNAKLFVKNLDTSQFASDKGLLASSDESSPSAAAALAFMKSVSLDGLCGAPTQVYLLNILKGRSTKVASAEATRVYIEAYNSGEILPEAGACAAADAAFRSAYVSGEDPIVASALAYMNNWPGANQGNPCAVAGIEYVRAVIDGKSHQEANKISARSFAGAFKALAKEGKALKDPARADATKAYWKALPNKPNDANGAAFTAFFDKIFDSDSKSPAYDPVCLASFDAFLDAFNAGEDLETSNLFAARAFFKAATSGSLVPADSACAAATKSYAKEALTKPSTAQAAAMIAYINEAIASGNNRIDPVCAAAAEAYFDAYMVNKEESEASEAAAVAYINALEENPDFDVKSPCGEAAQAYIDEFTGLE